MGGKKPGRLLMAAGLVCLAAALGLTGFNLWDENRARRSADQALAELHAAMPDPLPRPAFSERDAPGATDDPPALTLDGQSYLGTLSISALELEIPVQSDWSYPKLRLSPCRFQGAAWEDGFIVIGHNYRRHFGQLANMRPGDEVRFTDVEGGQYLYTVAALEKLDGDDLDALTADGWPLTLVTCTWSGQSRLAVRCARQTGTAHPRVS